MRRLLRFVDPNTLSLETVHQYWLRQNPEMTSDRTMTHSPTSWIVMNRKPLSPNARLAPRGRPHELPVQARVFRCEPLRLESPMPAKTSTKSPGSICVSCRAPVHRSLVRFFALSAVFGSKPNYGRTNLPMLSENLSRGASLAQPAKTT